jgi:hypothetical protein
MWTLPQIILAVSISILLLIVTVLVVWAARSAPLRTTGIAADATQDPLPGPDDVGDALVVLRSYFTSNALSASSKANMLLPSSRERILTAAGVGTKVPRIPQLPQRTTTTTTTKRDDVDRFFLSFLLLVPESMAQTLKQCHPSDPTIRVRALRCTLHQFDRDIEHVDTPDKDRATLRDRLVALTLLYIGAQTAATGSALGDWIVYDAATETVQFKGAFQSAVQCPTTPLPVPRAHHWIRAWLRKTRPKGACTVCARTG